MNVASFSYEAYAARISRIKVCNLKPDVKLTSKLKINTKMQPTNFKLTSRVNKNILTCNPCIWQFKKDHT